MENQMPKNMDLELEIETKTNQDGYKDNVM